MLSVEQWAILAVAAPLAFFFALIVRDVFRSDDA